MYFKKLEIFGFKSFAEKTVFNFEPGITAIVGPNGCGKSNVFDAIRWVLGEQSAKQLRGSGMEDVIFNGTDTKLALGFAEVNVTFDNHSRMLAISADEVVITRRLFRSGESEYLINKEVARLKDVTELFMGTGVGAEAYSLVQQGRVDLVVSAKPDDRRMIFDEAAGITKYKTKKREAQNKLKDTDQNLLRINDIVIEVKRQISSIARQAQKARRYKEEFEKLKGLETVFASWQLSIAEKERLEITRFLDEVKNRDNEHSGELEELRKVIERESLLLEELDQRVMAVREEDLKLESQIELANRQIIFNEERLGNIDENEARVAAEKASLLEKCRQNQGKIEEIDKALAELSLALEKSVALLNDKKNSLSGISALIDEYQETIRQNERKILDLTSRQVALKNQMTENMKENQGTLARRRRLDVEREKLASEKDEINRKLEGISAGMAEGMAARQKFLDDLLREKEILAGHNGELVLLTARLDGLEKKKLFLISQKEFIEKLKVQYEGIPDPVTTSRFLSSIQPTEKQTGVIGKVKTVTSIDPARYESLKQYLNDLEGGNLFEVVCETKFIELDPQEMSARIEAIEHEIKDVLSERDFKLSTIAEQSKLIEGIQQEVHSQDRRLSVCEAQHNDVGLAAEKLNQEFETILLEAREADESLGRLKQAEDSLSGELRSVEDEILFAREEIKARQALISEKRKEREDAAVLVAQMEGEASAFRDREKGWKSNAEMFRTDLNVCLENISRLDQEVVSFVERREKFSQEIMALNTGVEGFKFAKEALKETLSRHDNERCDVDQRITSLRAQTAAMEKEITENRESVHEREMQVQKIAFQEQSIKERILQRYGIDLSQPPLAVSGEAAVEGVVAPAFELPADFDPEKMNQDIQGLTKRCESFGAVNLVAIEELAELQGRFQFLTKQQSDLLSAKDSLEQTIRKINKTTRQLFVDTFVKVNDQFRTYFRMLFNGGEAQLILVDPENALESGIEIVARPPGKKLQNISLLSGGEKTMTAIALIFAVFKVNPSPFCVLDEIDAALDEANVDRFATVLKEFAKIAQFIIITHNKKTIAHADVMYGVTMQQTGVSRVVSVKLSDSKATQEPQPPLAQAKPEVTAGLEPQPSDSANSQEEMLAGV
ncbi:MAG: AAA family ATPase [Candidatus Omnitrophica bacterium]|nr:AAA family ATPase [Candidatus Omnitrophota bacterium]